LSFTEGVMVMDAALAAGAERGLVGEMLLTEPRRRGNVAARMAALFADERAESPGESISRVITAQAGLPAPDLQVKINDADGLIGRVDFRWRRRRLVGEFDGKIKYSRELAPGGDPTNALWTEKQQEDRLRRAGWNVVCWGWNDLRADALGPRIRAAPNRPGH